MCIRVFVILACVVSVTATAGPPLIVHLGQVLDASTNAPLVGVEVRGVYDDWPADVKKRWPLKTETDSTGVYGVTLNRPGTIHFVKAGYDSLVLHWPEEFDGADLGGCGVSLGPVRLHAIHE